MTAILRASGLACAYRGRRIFSAIDLAARPGEVLALLGPNGAGKTTLLRALARLLRPQAGTVELDGRPIWSLSPRQVAKRLAFAPQLAGSDERLPVEQVVALGRAPHRGWLLPFAADDRAAVAAALDRLGLAALRDRPIGELSGGEQRRAILARALAQQPAVLLLDEPTAHLDLRYQLETLELVRELARRDGLSVIVTLHDLNQAALCADRIALLSGGRIAADGPPAEVLAPATLEAAYGVPLALIEHPAAAHPLIAFRTGQKEP